MATSSRPQTTNSSIASSHTQIPHESQPPCDPPERDSLVVEPHGKSHFPRPGEKPTAAAEEDALDWDHDPENPRNWPWGKKWRVVSVVSLYTFCSPLASSMMAPGLPEVGLKYGISSPTLIALTLSIFLFSFAIGPLVFAPLSEMYGRTWVLHIANLFTMAFSFGCAFSPNVGSLIAFRFLSGLSGSSPIAIGGGSVSDVFAERDRANAMAIFTLGPLVGPVVGPIAGGFIADAVGIRWVFIVIACVCGFASLVGLPILRETYAPVIRMRRATRAGDPEATRKYHPVLDQAGGSIIRLFWINLKRPFILLFTSFICFILSLYMAFLYGIFYLMFSTFADFFSRAYGFSSGIGGLAYLGLGVGFFLATLAGGKVAGQVYTRLALKNGGIGKPEMRIPALFFGSFFIPVGLFWYGWSAQARIHWIMPIIGSGFFGFGMMMAFLPIQLYLVDTFKYAASALAAASLFRSLLGFAFPLFGEQMFAAMGEGGGNSLLAGLSIVLGIPFPVFIYFKGEMLRARNPLTADSVKRTTFVQKQPKASMQDEEKGSA